MNEQIRYRINPEVKHEYEEFITEKYGPKLGNAGLNVEKALKLFLTINGGSDYSSDPAVKEMIQSIRGDSQSTHTQNSEDINNSTHDDLERKMNEMQETLKELKEQLEKQSKPAKRNTDMDMFVQLFKEKYGHDHQVSINDISKLIVKTHGVMDKRSIQNRVDYLMSSGFIESFAPNVFNVKL
jgi:hypothetical protein